MIQFIEILVECLAEASQRVKLPVWAKILIFSILCFFPITVMILAIFQAYKATGIAGAIITGIIAILLVFLWVLGCYKIIKVSRRK